MVMAAMMGLTTQNWSVAWRTHYNSVMRHPNKQGQHRGGGGMIGGEAHQNLCTSNQMEKICNCP